MTERIHDAFAQVKASEELKASTMEYLLARRGRQNRGRLWLRPMAACAILTAALLGGGWWAVAVPVSYVSIDVNPSVEFSLNRIHRVVSAKAQNEDGALVLEGMELNGLTCAQAVDALLDSAAMEPYLVGGDGLTFTVAADSMELESALLAEIESWDGYRSHGARSYCTSTDSIAEAHDHGMSFGKYAAAKVLMEYDGTITVEDCHGMTMGELQSRIRSCESGRHEGQSGGHHGHGGHHGWGG